MLVVERLDDGTLAAIWGPEIAPAPMPDVRVYAIKLLVEDELDARLTAVRVALDVAGVPDTRAYTDEEREKYQTDAGHMIPLHQRVSMLAAERDAARKRIEWFEREAQQVTRELEKFTAGFAWKERNEHG